jgi:hypothetical protein
VFAQGNPEKLNKAKSLLLKAFLATLAIFTLQGFLIAAQGTVNRILPSEKTTTTQQTAPTTSELQSSCAARGGTLSSDNQCYGASDTQAASLQNCADKNIGVVCYIPQSSGTTKVGTCSYVSDSSSDKECRPAQVGDACVTTALINGTINSNNICETSQRPLVGDGGSCRGDFECSSPLKCVNNVCRTSGQSTTDGSSCLVDRRLPGTMKNGVCVSNTKAQTDVACTKANGGSCTINFQPGFCQDWRCIPNTAASQSYVDPCPALNQVHMSCTAANGNPGTCLLNVVVNPPKFVCVPK